MFWYSEGGKRAGEVWKRNGGSTKPGPSSSFDKPKRWKKRKANYNPLTATSDRRSSGTARGKKDGTLQLHKTSKKDTSRKTARVIPETALMYRQ